MSERETPNPDAGRAKRDHLFISYAWEDGTFAEWLALRLTAEGYRVWIDRFELLGGEPYPQDIDRAIKERTFRMLGLLSRHSLNKENPRKERTLALNLQRERGEELFIPLNVDGLRPTELNWMESDLTFIPFAQSWAQGLRQLLMKLDRIGTPSSDSEAGRALAARTYLPRSVLRHEPEFLRANLLAIESVPSVIRGFRLARPMNSLQTEALSVIWPYYRIRDDLLLSFWEPPQLDIDVNLQPAGLHLWKELTLIENVPSDYVAKPLMRKAILLHARSCGLCPTNKREVLYFPAGLLKENKLRFRSYSGRKTQVSAVGLRTFRDSKYQYHLAVTFDVRRDIFEELVVAMRVQVHLTDLDGQQLSTAAATARRKQVTRSWWNHEWLHRHLAICVFLAHGNRTIRIGRGDELVVARRLVRYPVAIGIDEKAVPKGQVPYRSQSRFLNGVDQ